VIAFSFLAETRRLNIAGVDLPADARDNAAPAVFHDERERVAFAAGLSLNRSRVLRTYSRTCRSTDITLVIDVDSKRRSALRWSKP
jgi:hypothetical protein